MSESKVIRIFLALMLFLLTVSCKEENNVVLYSYKDVIIKRIDSSGKSVFSYLKEGVESKKIWAEYEGINDGFSGYLIFEDNGKVLLVSGDGYFQQESDSFFEYRRILRAERPSDTENVCRVVFPIQVEKEKNSKSFSKVNIKYNKE